MITGRYDWDSLDGDPKLKHENKCMGGIPTTVEPRQIVNLLIMQGVGTGEKWPVAKTVCVITEPPPLPPIPFT